MDADPFSDFKTFGDLLRRHRLATGLTQEQLAESAGMSRRGVSDLERGVRTRPYRETLKLLVAALGLTGEQRTAFLAAATRRPAARVAPNSRFVVEPRVPLTPLIGRHQEKSHISALVSDNAIRLVTLTGPGGVGKTRLALAVAEGAGDGFADGRVFVDLAPLQDPDLVLSAVAAALGLREMAGRALADVVHDFLAGRGMLLILDNFEHLLDAAPVATDLLAAAPRVKILATSRSPLRVRGEHEYPVPPFRLPARDEAYDLATLETNEAVAFFVDRARAVRPDFTLTAESAASIAEICARLDGLPLALELAAARMRTLPPASLLHRLSSRLPLLIGGSRDAPARQRTLSDTLDWSHHLLSPVEQALFRRLGVFVGGWTLDAAEAVTNRGEEIEVLAGLDALVGQSLVRLDESGSEPRYGMLETIREYALGRLAASGELTKLREAHAAYFLSLAEEGKPHLYGAGQRLWLQRMEAEHPNFRAASHVFTAGGEHEKRLRLAANLGLFWFLHAHLAEGRAQLELALADALTPTPHRAEALTAIGRIVTCEGDLAAGESWLQQSEELARSLDVSAVLWQAVFQRGVLAEYEGDIDRAVAQYESALAVGRECDDPQAAGVALYALCDMAFQRGDMEASTRLAEESVALVRSAGDEFVLSLALASVGAVALVRGEMARALAAYHEALALALGIESDWSIANTLSGFAAVAAAEDDYAGAAHLLGAAETFREASHQERMVNFAQHAQTLQTVRAALGEAAFDAGWQAGRAYAVEEAANLPSVLGLVAERPPATNC